MAQGMLERGFERFKAGVLPMRLRIGLSAEPMNPKGLEGFVNCIDLGRRKCRHEDYLVPQGLMSCID